MEHALEFVAGIGRHRNVCRLADTGSGVLFIPTQSVEGRFCTRGRVSSVNTRETQHVIERSIFQHQYEDVLDVLRGESHYGSPKSENSKVVPKTRGGTGSSNRRL